MFFSIYESENDNSFRSFYNFSAIVVMFFGAIGALALTSILTITLNSGIFGEIIPKLATIITVGLVVALFAFVTGVLQVLLTSWFGEELILLFTWTLPFAFIGLSAYLYLTTMEHGVLIIGGLGLLFLLILMVKKEEIKMSARLIEVSAEVTRDNLRMMVPQIKSFILRTVLTVLMVPGIIIIFGVLSLVNPIIAALVNIIYVIMYLFVMAGIQAYADANNIAYANQWYSGTPSLKKSRKQIEPLKSAILKYAFLMTFIQRFRRRRSSSASGRLMAGLAGMAEYFGSFSLVLIVVKKMKSVAKAYKESTKTVFKTFVANIGGSLGFRFLDMLRSLLSVSILAGGGWYYASQTYSDTVVVYFVAAVILVLGYMPLNSMFKPVVNTYQLLLYRAYTGNMSSKFNKETKEIIKAVKKK